MLFLTYFRINIKSSNLCSIKNKIQDLEYGVTALGYNGIYSLITTTINEQIISTEKEIQS